jgi:RNA polymerase sigma-70 factor (ECF subfamily)
MAPRDAELVRRTLNGDPEAYGDLVLLYSDYVYGLSYGLLGHREDALELVQTVFLRAYERLKDLRDPDRFKSWLGLVATSQAKNRLRARRDVVTDQVPDVVSGTAAPLDHMIEAENRGRLREALRRIPEKNRMVLVLRYQSGLGYQEIAETVGIAVTTVRSRIFEGKKMLREQLEVEPREARVNQQAKANPGGRDSA